MAASESEVQKNSLIEALPPATDYLTYLALVEYNLKAQDLQLFNEILQDETLSINIGWDLVLLLMPMLPASEPCLQTIASLGNPREVLLKVVEALRFMEFDLEGIEQSTASETVTAAKSASDGEKNEEMEILVSTTSQSQKVAQHIRQFEVLLSMLSTLHRRIKTKYPSRFIATTLQGVLAAFSNAGSQQGELIKTILSFVLNVQQLNNPELSVHSGHTSNNDPGVALAADPEAQSEPSSSTEREISNRLLQGFLTHIVEAYMTTLSTDPDIPGLAWSTRIFEILQPQKVVPGRTSMEDRFREEQNLILRQASMEEIMSLATKLGLKLHDLQKGALEQDHSHSRTAEAEEDPPESVEDIPLSKSGALFLLSAQLVHHALTRSKEEIFLNTELFPTQLNLARTFIGTEEAGGLNPAGTEPAALIDAILTLGLIALDQENVGGPESDEQFAQYLQMITLISANSPEPQLRFHAHFLATSVLRTHPSDLYRLTFIRDTLEHCPIENLKASAVSWIKGEVIEANMGVETSESEEPRSVFTTPVCLETLSPFLFPDLSHDLHSSDLLEEWNVFKMNLSFYLAVLNFYYLLLCAPQLRETLNVGSLHVDNDIGGSFIGPLDQKSANFRKSLNEGDLREAEGDLGVVASISDLDILDDVLERVKQAVIELNK